MRSRSWRVARVASAHPAALGDLGGRPRNRPRRAAVNAATPLPAAPATTDRRPLLTNAVRCDPLSELTRLLQSWFIRGKVAVPRASADWRRYPQYIVPLSESSIDLIFAPAYGSNKKNASDIRLAIDALELVFTRPEIGTF